jgi:hypothetical protein
MATAPLFVAAPVNANAKAFGVALTLVGVVFILMVLSMVCVVFLPIWTEWRQTEKEPKQPAPTTRV